MGHSDQIVEWDMLNGTTGAFLGGWDVVAHLAGPRMCQVFPTTFPSQ